MASIISLFGLTDQQKWLAQQLWICESLDEIAELRDSVEPDMHHDLYLIMELIFLDDMDSHIIDEADCPDSFDIMEKIKHELDEFF